MEEIIKKIIQQNKALFGNKPIINKIIISFTNTLYNIDNKYIAKVCSDKSLKKKLIFIYQIKIMSWYQIYIIQI